MVVLLKITRKRKLKIFSTVHPREFAALGFAALGFVALY